MTERESGAGRPRPRRSGLDASLLEVALENVADVSLVVDLVVRRLVVEAAQLERHAAAGADVVLFGILYIN